MTQHSAVKNKSISSTNFSSDPSKAPTFEQLGVPQPLVSVLAQQGKKTAFPIQADTLPDTLEGRDVLGRGETGSGKTLAFSIPLVARLGEQKRQEEHSKNGKHHDSNPVRGLILAPTRELVNQIDEVVAPLAKAYGMKTVTIFGGVKYSKQINQLRSGAQIVLACPGRLEDLLRQNALSLDSVEITVLDEADLMADLGFLPAVKRLMELIPKGGQHLFFSATLDHGINSLVKRYLSNPKIHEIDAVNAHVETMTQHVFEVNSNTKPGVVENLASGTGKRILFTRTKHQAKNLAGKLTKKGIPSAQLHGNLSQSQRDRNLAAFKNGDANVLVATDVAARGVDIPAVELVVQVDPPAESKSFLHRSGRTARAGHDGDVVTLILPEQRRDTRRLLRQAGIKTKAQTVTPNSEEVSDLVGEKAEYVDPAKLEKAMEEFSRNRSRSHNAEQNGKSSRRGKNRARKNRSRGGVASRERRAQERRNSQEESHSNRAERNNSHKNHSHGFNDETNDSRRGFRSNNRRRKSSQAHPFSSRAKSGSSRRRGGNGGNRNFSNHR